MNSVFKRSSFVREAKLVNIYYVELNNITTIWTMPVTNIDCAMQKKVFHYLPC